MEANPSAGHNHDLNAAHKVNIVMLFNIELISKDARFKRNWDLPSVDGDVVPGANHTAGAARSERASSSRA